MAKKKGEEGSEGSEGEGNEGGEGNENTNNFDPEALAKTVAEQTSTVVDKKLNEFADKITAANSQKSDEEEEIEEELGGDDELLTRGQVKKMQKKWEEDQDKKQDARQNAHSLKATRDSEAIRLFPQLSESDKSYDADFTTAVIAEMDRRVNGGRDKDDPEILYDSATAIFSSDKKWRKNEDVDVEDDLRNRNNRQNIFQQTNRGGSGNKVYNKQQNEYANRAGISPERSKELRKRFGHGQ